MRDELCVPFEELDELLDTEKTALLNGNLDQVSRLFDRKSRLVDELNDVHPANSEDFTNLRKKLERNQNLLRSAADGVRSVAHRLSAVRRVRDSLETYDARGRRTTVDLKPSSKMEKRA